MTVTGLMPILVTRTPQRMDASKHPAPRGTIDKPLKNAVYPKRDWSIEGRIDAIIPYLERHSSRLDRLNTQTYALDDIIDTVSLE